MSSLENTLKKKGGEISQIDFCWQIPSSALLSISLTKKKRVICIPLILVVIASCFPTYV